MTETVVEAIVDALKIGGPWAVALVFGLLFVLKDLSKDKAARKCDEEFKAMFNKLLELSSAQVGAMTNMEKTIDALKELIRDRRER